MGLVNLSILVERIKKKLSGDFVSKTTYPSGSDAGVIKVDSAYATSVTSGGKLKATEITAEAYSEANDGAFVSKATLDNVLASFTPSGGFTKTEVFANEAVSPSASKSYSASINGYDFLLATVHGNNGNDVMWIPVWQLTENGIDYSCTCNPDGLRKITFTTTGFSLPSNMGADVQIYGIKF